MKNKICYIVNFYLGERRRTVQEVKDDKLFLLKKHIEYLYKIKSSLDTIIFNFNIRPDDYPSVSEIFKIVPKYIQGSEVVINFRENYGMSYGAWSDAFVKYQNKFNYYVFNEDDYFFVEDHWDTYLVNKFNSLEKCGYLCMVAREGKEWCNYKKHAGHSVGISSYEVLHEVYRKYGDLPHSKNSDYRLAEQLGQVNQSYSVIEVGYKIYDVRDDYRVEFAFSEETDNDIWRFFWWNEKYITKPVLLLKDIEYSYWECFDDEFKPYNSEL
jgi:hypothetical protein